MDSLITAAARALALGDPLGALQRVALREDAPALALRGTAMAQLGEFERARTLLRRAARAYGPRETLFRARCLLAEAEIALASRDLHASAKPLRAIRLALAAHGDHANEVHARYLEIRCMLLVGQLDQAQRALYDLDPKKLPPAFRAVHELMLAGIALRHVRADAAERALTRARSAAQDSRITALQAEVDATAAVLTRPAALLCADRASRPVSLRDVEKLFAAPILVVDACRYTVRAADHVIELKRRPALFTLARQLAERWPQDATRENLVLKAYRARRIDETYRARLRVEIGRLRSVLTPLADIVATRHGFVIEPRERRKVAVLTRLVDDAHAAILALLGDGEAWASSALALALGTSPRTVQRALESLAGSGKVLPIGKGRARRWMTAHLPGITTSLLLPVPVFGA